MRKSVKIIEYEPIDVDLGWTWLHSDPDVFVSYGAALYLSPKLGHTPNVCSFSPGKMLVEGYIVVY